MAAKSWEALSTRIPKNRKYTCTLSKGLYTMCNAMMTTRLFRPVSRYEPAKRKLLTRQWNKPFMHAFEIKMCIGVKGTLIGTGLFSGPNDLCLALLESFMRGGLSNFGHFHLLRYPIGNGNFQDPFGDKLVICWPSARMLFLASSRPIESQLGDKIYLRKPPATSY
ncbi:uncharacterized protein CIMG_13769 [Coccidioides immitis RS]|uniref:Uncharacterized protein n=1 Tax=Coccidioides immitis (strain RS) TaxID=246410 RepID=A0A0D8JWC7_COCIM|nr:uncharacterized protein CIMG_13769 [Coccidioides immitis RS]KJF61602.1 hypothetical protein CIMG_13769 [Coccidioides immitis RS]